MNASIEDIISATSELRVDHTNQYIQLLSKYHLADKDNEKMIVNLAYEDITNKQMLTLYLYQIYLIEAFSLALTACGSRYDGNDKTQIDSYLLLWSEEVKNLDRALDSIESIAKKRVTRKEFYELSQRYPNSDAIEKYLDLLVSSIDSIWIDIQEDERKAFNVSLRNIAMSFYNTQHGLLNGSIVPPKANVDSVTAKGIDSSKAEMEENPPSSNKDNSITEQLVYFKRLYDQGLINEADYAAKKNDLLGLHKAEDLPGESLSGVAKKFRAFNIWLQALPLVFILMAVVLFAKDDFIYCLNDDVFIFWVVVLIDLVGFWFTKTSLKKANLANKLTPILANSINSIIFALEDVVGDTTLTFLFLLSLGCAVLGIVNILIKGKCE